MRFLQSFYLLVLALGTLSYAKEVASPITSFQVGQANDMSNKNGYVGSAWELYYQFALSPEADNVLPGDYFTFDIDQSMYLDAGDYNFMVKDPDGHDIMRITNDGHRFTATYTDFVNSKDYYIDGNFFLQSTLNSRYVSDPGPLTITSSSGGKEFSDNINVKASIDANGAYKFARREGNRIQWTIQVPASPYDKLKIVDQITDSGSQYTTSDALLQDMTLNFYYGLTPTWNYDKFERVTDVSPYVQLLGFQTDSFVLSLVNIPHDEVTVQIVFYSDIAQQQDWYTNKMDWILWEQGYGYHSEPEWTGNGGSGSGDINDDGIFRQGSTNGGVRWETSNGGRDFDSGGEGEGQAQTRTSSSVESSLKPTTSIPVSISALETTSETTSETYSETTSSTPEPTTSTVESSTEPSSSIATTSSSTAESFSAVPSSLSTEASTSEPSSSTPESTADSTTASSTVETTSENMVVSVTTTSGTTSATSVFSNSTVPTTAVETTTETITDITSVPNPTSETSSVFSNTAVPITPVVETAITETTIEVFVVPETTSVFSNTTVPTTVVATTSVMTTTTSELSTTPETSSEPSSVQSSANYNTTVPHTTASSTVSTVTASITPSIVSSDPVTTVNGTSSNPCTETVTVTEKGSTTILTKEICPTTTAGITTETVTVNGTISTVTKDIHTTYSSCTETDSLTKNISISGTPVVTSVSSETVTKAVSKNRIVSTITNTITHCENNCTELPVTLTEIPVSSTATITTVIDGKTITVTVCKEDFATKRSVTTTAVSIAYSIVTVVSQATNTLTVCNGTGCSETRFTEIPSIQPSQPTKSVAESKNVSQLSTTVVAVLSNSSTQSQDSSSGKLSTSIPQSPDVSSPEQANSASTKVVGAFALIPFFAFFI